MFRSRALASATLASALALGCAEPQSPTTSAADGPVPSMAVERFTDFFGLGFGNDDHLVILGGTLENWTTFCATGEENWDEWNIFRVTRPDGSFKETWKADNLNALVWDLPADPCVDSPDYVGNSRLILTDSDVDLSGHGADGSGHRVHGTVRDASGRPYRLLAVFHLTVGVEYDSLDDFVIDWHAQKIELTPIRR
ncbi:MAG TPA: hypothetical protein VFZ26_08010 [Gemmatimonadales bacterium]